MLNVFGCSQGKSRVGRRVRYFQMCKAQQEKFEKLSEEVVHMSMVLGDDSDADLAEWRDLESSLTDERLQVFKEKKTELNKATVSFRCRNREVCAVFLVFCARQRHTKNVIDVCSGLRRLHFAPRPTSCTRLNVVSEHVLT